MEATPIKRKQREPSLTESTRKRRKAERVRKSNRNRISIGRWVKFKEEAGLKTHANVAENLLDHHLSRHQPDEPQPSTSTGKVTLTLFKFPFTQKKIDSQLVSEISVAETTDSECTLSADEIRKVKEVKTTTTGRQIVQKSSSSFVDPMKCQTLKINIKMIQIMYENLK